MRRLLLSACAAVLAAGTGVAIAGPSGGDLAAQCYAGAAAGSGSAPAQAQLPCKLAEGVTNQSGADCRALAGAADAPCTSLDGRDISAAEITAYQRSWVHQALSLQRGLDAAAPL